MMRPYCITSCLTNCTTLNNVNPPYLKVEIHLKLLTSQSNLFCDTSANVRKNRKYVRTVFFDTGGYFEISVLEIRKVNYFLTKESLTLLHSERPKLHTILAFLSAIGLN